MKRDGRIHQGPETFYQQDREEPTQEKDQELCRGKTYYSSRKKTRKKKETLGGSVQLRVLAYKPAAFLLHFPSLAFPPLFVSCALPFVLVCTPQLTPAPLPSTYRSCSRSPFFSMCFLPVLALCRYTTALPPTSTGVRACTRVYAPSRGQNRKEQQRDSKYRRHRPTATPQDAVPPSSSDALSYPPSTLTTK